MTKAKKTWVGPETEAKEHDFRGLMKIHTDVCKSPRILGHDRPGRLPYLFADLNGGPGMLEREGRYFPGSPLIAVETLERSGHAYRTIHFEQDPETAAQLSESLAPGISQGRTTVIPGQFQTGMKAWLAANGHQEHRYGLVYSDPIGDPIPVQAFNEVARYIPRVDLLAYVIANDQYKRANGGGALRGRVADDIAAVNKKHVLIRHESTAHQFTFILWTNWTEFPAWTARGFYPLTTPAGQAALDRITYTKAELAGRFNTPLFERGDCVLPVAPA